jgi:hypothetical protein
MIFCGCNNKSTNETNNQPKQVPPVENIIKYGQVLKTEYFDVVARVSGLYTNWVDEENGINLPEEKGIMYLIIKLTFKNTDTESRMLTDGTIWTTHNGKQYKFDKSETMLVKGWGIGFDQINPLTETTTRVVYKLPTELDGSLYYQPGRSKESDRILLGSPLQISQHQKEIEAKKKRK